MAAIGIKNILTYAAVAVACMYLGCSSVDDVDDQRPALFVEVDTANFTGTIDEDHQLYLIYFQNSNWTNPWLQQGTTGTFFINPTVVTFSTYIAVFWDRDGNTILSSGDECTGYYNVAPANPLSSTPLTNLDFIPLEWRYIVIPLIDGQTYP